MCSVLDSLEREYKRDEDWCKGTSNSEKITQLITKHQEQKEAFLKACTLARRTAETFLKYTSRSLQYYNYPQDTSSETNVKGERVRIYRLRLIFLQFFIYATNFEIFESQ